MVELRLTLFSFIMALSLSSLAKDIHLRFKNGLRKFNYSKLIKKENLKAGDKIYVSKNRYFIYEGYLGEGNSTRVFSVKDPQRPGSFAIRLPKEESFFKFNSQNGFPLLNFFIRSHVDLKEQNVSIPELYDFEGANYALVEKVDIEFGMDKFMARPDLIDKETYKIAEEALLEFVKEVARFSYIGDFCGEQMVFDRKRKKWVLLDWSTKPDLIMDADDPSVFPRGPFTELLFQYDDDMNKIPRKGDLLGLAKEPRAVSSREKKLWDKIEEVHQAERKKVIDQDKKFLEAHFKGFREDFTKEEWIKFYTTKPKPYSGYINRELKNHMLLRSKLLNKYQFTINEILKLKEAHVIGMAHYIPYLRTFKDQIRSFDELFLILQSQYDPSPINEPVKWAREGVQEHTNEIIERLVREDKNYSLSKQTLELLSFSPLVSEDAKALLRFHYKPLTAFKNKCISSIKGKLTN